MWPVRAEKNTMEETVFAKQESVIKETPETNIGVTLHRAAKKAEQPRPMNFVERLNSHSNLKETYLKTHTLVWDTRDGNSIEILLGGIKYSTKHIEFQGVGNRKLYIFSDELDEHGKQKIGVFDEYEAESLIL